ncbi:Reticulon-like protein [Melia azedarach]|uniref:Reticulon-like protein n=1 Tax=Melia azedarach TaxID=155640 RepID=A0ACC1Z398_MELAZ|nr:Reticulon-like protein [Melia azedarach]
MDSNPSSQTKSASRLARMTSEEPLHLSLDLVSPSPKKTSSLSPLPPPELLLLSPSPLRKSRTRLAERLEMAEEVGLEPTASRRRCKSKGAQTGMLGCASPRNNRRSRRRSEMEIRDERDIGFVDEIGKLRKRRHSVRSKKEKLSLVPCVASPSLSPKMDDGGEGNLDRIGQMLADLIMWRDVAKSSLWFGFGCLCFLSSGFAKGVSFSIFSAISQLGLLFLGASFFSNSILQRNNGEQRRGFKLRDEDILRFGRLILPAANLAISKTRELFSGEPLMTLKVVPFLLLGAEYGHLITMWRLCGIGFFISFTVPKLYSCYSNHINQKVENTKYWLLEAWGACSHKKVVAASAAIAFWNLSTVKTRIFTAFISLVILRCCRQHLVSKPEAEEAVEGEEEQQQQQALVAEVQDSQK